MTRLRTTPRRAIWLVTGLIAFGCGLAGVVLPLVPTTPLMLLAAFAFARSSPRLHRWLVGHRRFGPMIRDWQEHGSIGRRAKVLAVVAMAATFAGSWLAGFGAMVLAIQAVTLGLAGTFVLSRPSTPQQPAGGCA